MTRAVGIVSGGLDSLIAVKLLLEQGIEVHALHFEILFSHRYQKDCEKYAKIAEAAERSGYTVHFIDIVDDYLEDVLKKPKFGYGRNMNPCLDCHIYMLKKAGEFMKQIDAQFVFTGEVLGQRPMTQLHDKLLLINRETGLDGYLLRPLSAKLLQPTIAEQTGLVDREKLEAIEGRCRSRQIELAARLGINEYPSPAGGCLYTDCIFSQRIKDLMKHDPGFGALDMYLLRFGRHLRIDDCRLIIGRDFAENTALEKIAPGKFWMCQPETVPGPSVIIVKDSCHNNQDVSPEILSAGASMVARYAKKSRIAVSVISPEGKVSIMDAEPAADSYIDTLRI